MALILFITCNRWPALSESDTLVATALQALGHQVQPLPWQHDLPHGKAADLLVLRSNWDYHYALDDFTAWLAAREAAPVPLYNPPSLVRWNLQKGYLLDLQASGVTIPVTAVLDAADDPQAIYTKYGWDRAVIKPLAGASGHLVECVAQDGLAAWRATVRAQRPEQRWLIQEFIPEIAAGEVSLVFIEGSFSHAIAKRPQPGEFRINSQYQGQIARVTPDAAVIEQAERVLAALPALPLYARVDGVVTAQGEFCLIELELNEPGLYFPYAPEQAVQFAAAIAAKVG